MNLSDALDAIEGYVEIIRLGSRNEYVRKLQEHAFHGIIEVVSSASPEFIAKIIVNRATDCKDFDGKGMY